MLILYYTHSGRGRIHKYLSEYWFFTFSYYELSVNQSQWLVPGTWVED